MVKVYLRCAKKVIMSDVKSVDVPSPSTVKEDVFVQEHLCSVVSKVFKLH